LGPIDRGRLPGVAADAEALILSFDGGDITPTTVDARRLLAASLAYLDALASVVQLIVPMHEAELVLTVEDIAPGSVKYKGRAALRRTDGTLHPVAIRSMSDTLDTWMRATSLAPRAVRPKVSQAVQAARQLPSWMNFNASVGGHEYEVSEAARSGEVPTIRSTESLRARVLRAGGIDPRVQFDAASEVRSFSLASTPELVIIAGRSLYGDVDIEATVLRSARAPFQIVGGTLTHIDPVDEQHDPVETWDRWYKVSGSPWAGVTDIEGELGRND